MVLTIQLQIWLQKSFLAKFYQYFYSTVNKSLNTNKRDYHNLIIVLKEIVISLKYHLFAVFTTRFALSINSEKGRYLKAISANILLLHECQVLSIHIHLKLFVIQKVYDISIEVDKLCNTMIFNKKLQLSKVSYIENNLKTVWTGKS